MSKGADVAIPDSWPQVLIFLILVVPGIAFTTARDSVVGPRSTLTVAGRLLEAAFISVIFDAIYLIGGGALFRPLPDHDYLWIRDNLGLAGLLGLALFVGVPVAVSLLFVFRQRLGWSRLPKLPTTYVNIPTAWDRVAQSFAPGQFVRVRLEDGSWVGGWFADKSFVSTFPQARDIFIESEWSMKVDGSFGDPLPESTGIWLAITDTRTVEWILPRQLEHETEK
jgi:hypothetical protein